MNEFTDRRGLHDVNRERTNNQDARGNLRHQFDDCITSAQDNCYGGHAKDKTIDREFLVVIDAWYVEPEKHPEKIKQNCGGCYQSTRLPDSGLNNGGYQHVPDRKLFPCGGISVEHAAAGCMREPNRHFETVVLEDVGDRQTPQQRIPIAPACDRGRDQVAGAYTGHH